MNLNEYKLQINSDEDLEKWKSTWAPGKPIPQEVTRYIKEIVMPRIDKENKEFINSIFIK